MSVRRRLARAGEVTPPTSSTAARVGPAVDGLGVRHLVEAAVTTATRDLELLLGARGRLADDRGQRADLAVDDRQPTSCRSRRRPRGGASRRRPAPPASSGSPPTRAASGWPRNFTASSARCAARTARSASAAASGVSSGRGVASTFAAASVRLAASRCSSAAVPVVGRLGGPAVEQRGDPDAETGGDRGQGAGARRVAPQDRADRIRLQRGPRRQLALRPASTLKVRADPGCPWLLVHRILRYSRVAVGRRDFGAVRRGVLDRQQPHVRRLVAPVRRDAIADLHRPAVQRRPLPTGRRPAVLVGYLGAEDEDVVLAPLGPR